MCRKAISKKYKPNRRSRKMKKHIVWMLLIGITFSCQNREVNHADGPNFREIHEDIQYHFDQVKIDGLNYYILERDRNNPHEGFGFMALDGRLLTAKQDSSIAYMKTILEMQVRLNAKLNNISYEASEQQANELFDFFYQQSRAVKDSVK